MFDPDTTRRMTDEELDDFLRTQGVGILALAKDGMAYAIPESFGFDGGEIYFQFGYSDRSKKVQYMAKTVQACFVVYELNAADDWRSVIAIGTLRQVTGDEADHAAQTVADNASSPGLSIVQRELDEFQFATYALDIEELTGRTSAVGG